MSRRQVEDRQHYRHSCRTTSFLAQIWTECEVQHEVGNPKVESSAALVGPPDVCVWGGEGAASSP